MSIQLPHFNYEDEYRSQGYRFIAGIDEVGRGAWAGPVIAGVVILPQGFQIQKSKSKKQNYGIKDSKLLTPKKREELAIIIKEIASDWAIGMASVKEIDEIGIHQATFLAYERALGKLSTVDFLLIDAYEWKNSPIPYLAIIKGDNISLSIAAASIIAKVERDKMMGDLGNQFANYSFHLHKGYGTKLHKQELTQFGLTDIHRRSFKPCSEIVG